MWVIVFFVVTSCLESEVRTNWRAFSAKNETSILVKSWLKCSPDESEKFLVFVLTEICIYLLSMSALMGSFRSQKRQITASRLLRRSGPGESMSFRQFLLNLDFAFETRRSFPGFNGFVTPCSCSIHTVERIPSLGNLRKYFLVKPIVNMSWYIASLSESMKTRVFILLNCGAAAN